MKLSRPAILLYMSLVFASGAVLGVFGERAYNVSAIAKAKAAKPSPEQYRRDYIEFMHKRLSLTDSQVTRLGLIFDETRALMNEIHERAIPEQQNIRRSQTEKIRAILNPEQQPEYDRLLKEREERMKKGGKKPGGPGF